MPSCHCFMSSYLIINMAYIQNWENEQNALFCIQQDSLCLSTYMCLCVGGCVCLQSHLIAKQNISLTCFGEVTLSTKRKTYWGGSQMLTKCLLSNINVVYTAMAFKFTYSSLKQICSIIWIYNEGITATEHTSGQIKQIISLTVKS